MSKFTITHLKAPWPLGAKAGDVIELAHVPAWALGKCSPAADDAEVTVSFEPALTVNVPPAGDAVAGRDALETEAKALGVSFNARTSDETLTERIIEAKAKQA